MKFKQLISIALCSAALSWSSPAHSQMYDGPAYAFPVPDYVGPMISASILQSSIDANKASNARNSKKKSTTNKKTTRKPPTTTQKTATAAQRAKLTFTPSADVTRKVHETFARQVAPNDSKKREQFLKVLNSGQLQREYNKLIQPVGLKNNNVADAATAYIITNWQIVHGQNDGNRTATLAQRRKMENALALSAKIQAMNNAKKQEVAQSLQIMTILAIAAYSQNQRTGNTKGQQQLRQNLIQSSRKMGVDLQKLKLTNQGLV